METIVEQRQPTPAIAPQSGRLVVFSDDWGRHPSSCQHLVRHLLADCDVSWVNTIGTRSPRLNLATLGRGLEKLSQWRRRTAEPKAPESPRPQVLNPLMWPGFRSAWQRRLNRHLLSRFLRKQLPALADSVLLTTVPIVADLLGSIPVLRSVYYCVDDFSAWPGLDSRPLREMEEKLVAAADVIVAAGDNLADRIRRLGREATVITHGIDLDHWTKPAAPSLLLADFPRPIALFWGLIDRRMDVEALTALGRSMTEGSLVLVGPEQDPDPALRDVPRLKRLGAVAYAELPAIAAAADVLVMPYLDLPVTRAMQPLKLKEYLATGKPVVASALPAVEPWRDALDVVEHPQAFAAAVRGRFVSGLPGLQATARERLRLESWKEKAGDLRTVLFGDSR